MISPANVGLRMRTWGYGRECGVMTQMRGYDANAGLRMRTWGYRLERKDMRAIHSHEAVQWQCKEAMPVAVPEAVPEAVLVAEAVRKAS